MLCSTCQNIFAKPRDFGFGSYYSWSHVQWSFEAAVDDGCHLCNLVLQHLLYQSPNATTAGPYLFSATYAFKALSREWARTGRGLKWLTPKLRNVHYLDTDSEYNRAVEQDPTILRIKELLLAKSSIGAAKLDDPLVWDLYQQGPPITLPVEVAKGA